MDERIVSIFKLLIANSYGIGSICSQYDGEDVAEAIGEQLHLQQELSVARVEIEHG